MFYFFVLTLFLQEGLSGHLGGNVQTHYLQNGRSHVRQAWIMSDLSELVATSVEDKGNWRGKGGRGGGGREGQWREGEREG